MATDPTSYDTFFSCPIIKDEDGNEYPVRPKIRLEGAGGVSVASITDDEANNETVVVIDGSGAGGRWKTALDLDFRTETPRSVATDGAYTIGGKVWTKYNSAADATAMAISSAGLVITPAVDSAWSGNAFTLPALTTPLFGLHPSIAAGAPLRVTIYTTAHNGGGAAYDDLMAGIVVTTSTDLTHGIHGYVAGRGYVAGVGGNGFLARIIATQSNSDSSSAHYAGAPTAAQALGTANDVMRLHIPNLGIPTSMVSVAAHGADGQEIPADRYFDTIVSLTGASGAFGGLWSPSRTNMRLAIGAQRGGSSSTGFSITVARMVVEYFG